MTDKKPSKYPIELTEKQQEYVISELINGKTMVDICAKMNIHRFDMWNYCDRYPDFHKSVRSTREETAHDLVDTLITIADGAQTIMEVQAVRVKSENIRWVASKRNPQVYGDAINLNVSHSLDLSKVLAAADSRVIPLLQHKQDVIEARLVSETQPMSNASSMSKVSETSKITETTSETVGGSGNMETTGGFDDLL